MSTAICRPGLSILSVIYDNFAESEGVELEQLKALSESSAKSKRFCHESLIPLMGEGQISDLSLVSL